MCMKLFANALLLQIALKCGGLFFIARKAAESEPLKFRVFQTELHIDPEYAKNEKA